MKKIFISIAAFLFVAGMANAQEKGSYLTIGGGFGPSGFLYDWDGVPLHNDNGEVIGTAADSKDKLRWGWNAKIGYSYFFAPHWGVGTGIGISYYHSQGQYNRGFAYNEYFDLGQQTANNMNTLEPDNHDYSLQARIANWREDQRAYTFDIPLMLQYQTKFGEKKRWGIYGGAGVRLHIPLSANYKVKDGRNPTDERLNISGLFESSNINYGSPYPEANQGQQWNPALPQHGFGRIHDPNSQLGWNGKIDMKWSLSGIANFGFLWTLAPRLDLLTGAYIDYGLTNVKKGDSKPLMQAPDNYNAAFPSVPTGNNTPSVGNGIKYSGIINSQQTDKARLFNYGAEIGLRWKLCGKTESKKLVREGRDTVYIYKRDTLYIGGVTPPQLPHRNDTVYFIPKPPYAYRVVVLNEITKQPIAKAAVDMGTLGAMLTDSIGMVHRRFDESASFRTNVNAVGYKEVSITSIVPSARSSIVTDTVYLKIEAEKRIELKNIYYDFDKWNILPESAEELDKVVRFMKDNPDVKVELGSHTDSRGSDSYNLWLSGKRADAAVAYIVSKGIDPALITAKGYGETQPRNGCVNGVRCTEEQYRENRRTEIFVTGYGAAGHIKQTKGKY